MEKVILSGGRYGNTVFEAGDGRIMLSALFGMPMYTPDVSGPERLQGITDSDFSLDGQGTSRMILERWEKSAGELQVNFGLEGSGIKIKSLWRVDTELGILSRKDWVENTDARPVTVYRCQPRFLFAPAEYDCYVQNSTWCYENIGGWEPVGRSGVLLQCEGGRTTQGASPMLGLRNTRLGRGVVFHIIPKGNWEIRLQKASAGVGPQGSAVTAVRLGQSGDGFACRIQPGKCLEFPEVLVQSLPDGSLFKQVQNLQLWLKGYERPGRCMHRVVYNPWFNCFDDIKVDELLRYARAAKKLGCEIFEVDAGWYGQGADWSCCVGDWREKLDGAFYGKLKDFSDQVRSLGLGFGLWMEPERIMGGAPMRKQHPEWFARGSSGGYYPRLWEEQPYNYIKSEILRLIETYALAWLKMDFNFELEEDETRSGFLYYYESLYRLMDEIKALHPEVFLEACASGGLRTDINTMLHFDGHFICDNVNPYDGQSMYEQLLVRTFPTKVYQWMAVQKGADIPAYFREVSDVEKTVMVPAAPGAGFADFERIDMDFLCKLMIKGMFGISGDITTLDEADQEVLAGYISVYKKIRPLLMESIVTMDGEPGNIGDRDRWSVLEYYEKERDESLIYVYRFGDIRSSHQVFPAHIRPEGRYRVSKTEESMEMTGEALLDRGIGVELPKRNSGAILHICRMGENGYEI